MNKEDAAHAEKQELANVWVTVRDAIQAVEQSRYRPDELADLAVARMIHRAQLEEAANTGPTLTPSAGPPVWR